mmetsp:Transcript_135912/g.221147  ORF Transcript_135912/g.221147 Transcript_135912/m.221147 type:complete len:162 (+) Transcript_135912:17-502(+)
MAAAPNLGMSGAIGSKVGTVAPAIDSGTMKRAWSRTEVPIRGADRTLGRTKSSPSLVGSTVALQEHGPGWHVVESRYRGRPALDPSRAAGQASGAPLPRHYITKFDDPARTRDRTDINGLTQHQIARARWQTKKYCAKTYPEPMRPHAVSDFSGKAKMYFG